jgi:hypothetical protein
MASCEIQGAYVAGLNSREPEITGFAATALDAFGNRCTLGASNLVAVKPCNGLTASKLLIQTRESGWQYFRRGWLDFKHSSILSTKYGAP